MHPKGPLMNDSVSPVLWHPLRTGAWAVAGRSRGPACGIRGRVQGKGVAAASGPTPVGASRAEANTPSPEQEAKKQDGTGVLWGRWKSGALHIPSGTLRTEAASRAGAERKGPLPPPQACPQLQRALSWHWAHNPRSLPEEMQTGAAAGVTRLSQDTLKTSKRRRGQKTGRTAPPTATPPISLHDAHCPRQSLTGSALTTGDA